MREALDRVGKAAKQQADKHIARKGWTLTFHSFRHTVTNRLLWKESIDPGLVDSLLGWSSTEREEIATEVKKDLMRLHYGHETPAIERLREAMERLKFPELD